MNEVKNLPGVPPPVGPYSHVAITSAGCRLGHVAGQVGADDRGALVGDDFNSQCEAAFKNLRRVILALGARMADVAYVRGYLVGSENLPLYKKAREQFYSSEDIPPPPTTTLVVAGLYDDRCLIELDAVVALPE